MPYPPRQTKALVSNGQPAKASSMLTRTFGNRLAAAGFSAALLYFILQNSALPFAAQLKNRYLLFFVAALAIFFIVTSKLRSQAAAIGFFALLILSAFVSFRANDCMPLIIVCLTVVTRKLSPAAIAKSAFIILTAALAMLYALTLFGYIPNYSGIRAGVLRHAYGMTQPTVWTNCVFFAAAAYVCMRRRMRADVIAVLFVAALLTFFAANGRNDTSSIVLLAILPLGLNAAPLARFKMIWRSAALAAYPVFAAAAYGITKLYAHHDGVVHHINLNNLFTGRLYLGYEALHRYPITWFGQHVIENGGGKAGALVPSLPYFYIDSSYLHLLLKFGIVFTGLFFVWIIWRTRELMNGHQPLLAIIVFIAGFQGMWEANLFSPLNFTLFMLCAQLQTPSVRQAQEQSAIADAQTSTSDYR
ncbi:MAG: polysaccharide polymerase [Sporolactobacillus sp.]